MIQTLMNDRPPRGRGSAENPPNRFPSKTIITRNDSPDVGFTLSVYPYMGCEHG